MKKILFFLVAVGWPLLASAQYVSQVWSPDNGDGTYTNPVINADYSDPDVCVGASGEDYYLTASSFQCVPGLPILHSKDLVNWEIINHALTSLYEGDAELEKHFSTPQHGNGVWAPSIRYHGGWYYIYWGDPDFGVYMVKTQDPASKWETPVCVIKGQGYIDTCPLWDDDGRCYLVNGWANSRSKFASVLTVREMSPDGTRPIGQPVIVFDGNGTENRTCEGPKFYKRDGWYWIMCPAGGVPTGFQLAMRSKSPFGPYEHKIVLAQGKTNINGPHQGGWVHTKHGEDWFLHFQDKEAYGRVVHLNPVDWSSGWPVMGKKGEPVTTFRKPKVNEKVIVNSEKFATAIVNPVESDEFNAPVMGKQWQWHANYDEKFGVPTAFGAFRIYTYKLSKDWKNFWEVPNLLLQKTPADAFIATTKLRMTSKADGQFGGLIMMGLDYSALVVKRTGKAFQLVQMTCKGADKGNTQTEKVIATLKPTAEDKTDYKPGIHEDIYLRLTVKDSKVRFAWSQDGKTFTDCGDEFQMKEGKWIGAKFGFIAAETDPKCDRGWVDADWIRVTSLDEVVWFDGRHPITYQVPRKVEPVVTTALEMWKDDMRQVTGMVPVASRQASIKLSADSLLPADGFRISTKGGQIIIEGGNGRGMAYGLLELSRRAGVSPWIWWGDVVPEKKERLAMSEDFVTMQSPSVAYRGIFINDEDWSLRPWSCSTYEPAPSGHIGPQTYKKIFQLLLRLRANAVWPAMHPGTTAFFRIPGAKAVADSCGIVIGTSHCEPLLRNNVGEWDVKERGTFNYRTNREAVHQYWIERLKEVAPLTSPRLREGNKGVMFTIGMRGIHDSSMEGYKTEQEKFDGLQQVIDDQQELLRQYIGDPSEQMQVFVPYKEVLQLYEKGLQVPDYVTLMWCDDNYGYMTRLSDAKEQRRSGGGGVYYHLSYWGRPHDYLWLTTTQPGLVYNEMRQAYDHNVRKLWLANVHDPKVAGYDLELFLDMAWNIDGVTGETLNSHYRSWLCREFGRETGERLFPAMHEFYRLCAIRRPEFMGYTQVELDKRLYERGLSKVDTVPMSASEAASRLVAFDRIKAVIATCKPLIRPELHDAWFAAIEYPVHAAAAMSRKILSDRHESHQAYEEILSLTARYHEMKNGKWRNLMDAAPRKLPVFEDVNATLSPEPKPDLLTVAACDYTSASDEAKVVQMLGHSMNAVALPKDGMLTYHFEVKEDGDYAVETALIPTQSNDHGDLRYSVCIDDQQPVVYNLKEPFRSEEWKQNVLRGQALRHQRVSLSKGSHTLTLRAIDDHIVVDQWKLAEL